MPKHGDLRVWWIPQVPGKPFFKPVANALEGRLLLDTLAEYDLFQLDNNIKPDYSNVGGLHYFDFGDKIDGPEGSWCEWESSDGYEIDEYSLDDLRGMKALPECCYR